MPLRLMRLFRALIVLPLASCVAPAPQSISEPIRVYVNAADPSRAVRFALDVVGGQAELHAPQMSGWATDARLIASTPAEAVLRPSTTAAFFRALSSGRLNVRAITPHASLSADGAHVRIASTVTGLSIRDY
ncbi:MAG TPA: hypothetical protein VGQ56_20780 [Gemmatimonadaceae bacterium]|nr:hypothetical protein [Gemmatimonadaceae bacterium]